MVVNAFYENVPKHKAEHRALAPGEREENLVLEFRPNPPHDMLVACLWNHHPGNERSEDELFSFAPSPMNRRRKSQLPVTIAASFRSSGRMWRLGRTRIHRTSRRCRRSSTTATGRITSIGWRPDLRDRYGDPG